MKIAVCIPNEILDEAARLARRTGKTRSRMFTEALREYVERHSPEKITESINRALAQIGQNMDPFVSSASQRRLEQVEW